MNLDSSQQKHNGYEHRHVHSIYVCQSAVADNHEVPEALPMRIAGALLQHSCARAATTKQEGWAENMKT